MKTSEIADHRDWLFDAGRDIELQDFMSHAALTTGFDDCIAAAKTALDGHTGRLGIHGPFEGLDIDNKDAELRSIITARYLKALEAADRIVARAAGGAAAAGADVTGAGLEEVSSGAACGVAASGTAAGGASLKRSMNIRTVTVSRTAVMATRPQRSISRLPCQFGRSRHRSGRLRRRTCGQQRKEGIITARAAKLVTHVPVAQQA